MKQIVAKWIKLAQRVFAGGSCPVKAGQAFEAGLGYYLSAIGYPSGGQLARHGRWGDGGSHRVAPSRTFAQPQTPDPRPQTLISFQKDK